jgi:hypothetical protein
MATFSSSLSAYIQVFTDLTVGLRHYFLIDFCRHVLRSPQLNILILASLNTFHVANEIYRFGIRPLLPCIFGLL